LLVDITIHNLNIAVLLSAHMNKGSFTIINKMSIFSLWRCYLLLGD